MGAQTGMTICLNYGEKCKGFTTNIGPRTVTFKTGVHGKPKFALGIVTFLKNEYKDMLSLKIKDTETCAPKLVSAVAYNHIQHQIISLEYTVK